MDKGKLSASGLVFYHKLVKTRSPKAHDYDATDEIASEYDLDELRKRAQEEGREYRGKLYRRFVELDPDIADFFKTSRAVNEALRPRDARYTDSGLVPKRGQHIVQSDY
jgi:hypothetical protein